MAPIRAEQDFIYRMVILIPLAMGLASLNCYLALYSISNQPVRRSLLTAAIGLFFFIGVSTEILGAFKLIAPWPVTVAWISLDLALAVVYVRLQSSYKTTFPAILSEWLNRVRAFGARLGYFTGIMIAVMSAVTLLVAIVATPNNLDALSYHLSRLGYWIQQGHVGHYASHIERSISFSPLSEYMHLHTFLLAGSERYFQLLQWCCLLGIMLWISMLVEMFSDSRLVMRVALMFAATLPIAVLESMTAQNDLVVTFFVLAAAFLVFDCPRKDNRAATVLIPVVCALGMMTKGTFAFYVLPFGVYLFFSMVGKPELRKPLATLTVATMFAVLMLNAPFWYRTWLVFGSPVGTISNGNQTAFEGPAGYVSSVSKHVFLHLGFISPGNRYNEFLENQLYSLHTAIGTSVNAQGNGMPFKMNKLNFNEDFAHNFLGIWLILFCIPLMWLLRLPKTAKWYSGLAFLSFLVFCFFISYQIYGSRLHIPFFLLMSPVAGLVYGGLIGNLGVRLLTVSLWLSALPFALLSASHPLLSTKWFFEKIFPPVNTALHLDIRVDASNLNLKQPSALFTTPERAMWGDRWPEMQVFKAKVNAYNPKRIGFDFNEASLDYAYQFMLRAPGRTFAHVLVDNPSKMLENPAFQPDVIVSEQDNGPGFRYHGKVYRLDWERDGMRIYIPAH